MLYISGHVGYLITEIGELTLMIFLMRIRYKWKMFPWEFCGVNIIRVCSIKDRQFYC